MGMKSIDFNEKKAPTQAQFNEYHKEPVDYGEDGSQLLGSQYTKEEAIDIFTKHWEKQTGEKPDFDIGASVIFGSAGWTDNPDKDASADDYCFVWTNRVADVKPRYEAWTLWM